MKMSKKLAVFKDKRRKELHIGAFVGEGGNASVQFTTENDYVQLDEIQIRDLIKILKNRINRKKGFRATD